MKQDEFKSCLKCKKQIYKMQLCRRCYTLGHLIDRGNKKIGDFIEKCKPFINWIPYSEFTNIEKIRNGGFSEIYKATRGGSSVVLKVLNNSQNANKVFLNEVAILCLFIFVSLY